MPCSRGSDSVPADLGGVATLDAQTRLELEATAFRGLVAHLQRRTDVQNIDLMNLAGFCRNCLSRWYREEAKKVDVHATDRVEVQATAEVQGDVYTRRIVVLEGGSVNGSIKMGSPPEPGFDE